jgi:hypothetical protein
VYLFLALADQSFLLIDFHVTEAKDWAIFGTYTDFPSPAAPAARARRSPSWNRAAAGREVVRTAPRQRGQEPTGRRSMVATISHPRSASFVKTMDYNGTEGSVKKVLSFLACV